MQSLLRPTTPYRLSRFSERVLFPVTPSQSNGIEDARFVLFQDDDGTRTYCATYTAYDGKMVLPQFIETADFLHFKFITLNGPAVQNKGMALFPRKINGHYAMLGRQDKENIYIMFSDHLHFWQTTQLVLKPAFPWEFMQLGNCGSPIETEAGWLVLSHGVGPMRKYCIGAFLLDRDDPPTAIFASNDVMAMGAMDAIRGRGLRIPEDMSILGFDDIPQAAMVRPALTTVRQPLEHMGRLATQMLIDQLKNPEKEIGRVELPTQLIVRDSTLSPKDRAGVR